MASETWARITSTCQCCGFVGATGKNVEMAPALSGWCCDLCIGVKAIDTMAGNGRFMTTAQARRECYIGNAIIAAIRESKR